MITLLMFPGSSDVYLHQHFGKPEWVAEWAQLAGSGTRLEDWLGRQTL